MNARAILRPAILASLSIALLVCGGAASRADDIADARALVERILNSSGSSAGALRGSVDQEGVARAVLGPYWQSASAKDQSDFVDAMMEEASRVVGGRLSRDNGAATIVGARKIAAGDVLVASTVAAAGKRPSNIDWRIRHCSSGPCVEDVLLDGASVVVQRRNEYSAWLKANNGSVANLVAWLRTKSAQRLR